MKNELPQLTLQQKWETAESNLIYFIVCGISYAKYCGQTAEDFGTWAGQVAEPFWDEAKSKGPRGLVEGISSNKQQFQDFEMEILDESEISIRGRMKCFGENLIRKYFLYKISVGEYIQFFNKKWVAIANHMELEYKQHAEGDWLIFTVTKK